MSEPPGALRAYRMLLRLFPSRFRRDRGAEMERLFLDMYADWRRERGRPGPGFWGAVAWDTTRAALGERMARWTSTGGARSRHARARRDAAPRSWAAAPDVRHRSASAADLAHDLRLALRRLARQPLHSGAVVLLMAVGVAGNAAMFRIFDGLFLEPLPFHAADRLVDVDERAPQWNLESVSVAIEDFRRWSSSSRAFEAMTAFSSGGGNLALDGSARRVTYVEATHEVDDVLGLEPLHGRFFTAAEDHPDAPRVALLSVGFWEAAFAGDAGVLGRTVRLDGLPVEIVGVLPREAGYLGEADLWMPLREDDESSYYLDVIGRLAPGVTVEQALEDLTAIHRAAVEERPENAVTFPTVVALREAYLGDYRLGAGVLLGAVGVVLLIACGNIAGLTLARSMSRMDELVVRKALGAGRGRIVRELLTESFLLAAAGAALGTGLGLWGSARLVSVLAEQFPPWATFELDTRFLAFTVALTAASAILFGLAPALRVSGAAAASSGPARSTASLATRRAMGLLVVGEVALAVGLLIVSGLAAADLRALARLDPGYRTDGVVTYRLQLPSERYPERQDRLTFAETYLESLERLPGVQSADLASLLPLGGHSGWFFEVEGGTVAATDNAVVLRRWVSPAYLENMGVSVVRGRTFDRFDGREEGAFVIVVNESFVRTHVPEGTDPVGQRIRTGPRSPWYTIVGVAEDVRHYGVHAPARPGTYEPMIQNPLSSIQVALVATGELDAVTAGARAATTALDPELPLYDVRTLAERLDRALLARRASSWLVGAFSAVALILAVAGMYGVISYSVGRRAHEISIRMAMGARAARVMAEVVGHGMVLVGVGALLGVLLARAGSGLVSTLLLDVSASDPVVYGVVASLVLAVAVVANALPARRAASIEPMRALRGD